MIQKSKKRQEKQLFTKYQLMKMTLPLVISSKEKETVSHLFFQLDNKTRQRKQYSTELGEAIQQGNKQKLCVMQ